MKGGENEMQSYATDRLRLVNEIRAEQMKQAAIGRRFEKPAPSMISLLTRWSSLHGTPGRARPSAAS